MLTQLQEWTKWDEIQQWSQSHCFPCLLENKRSFMPKKKKEKEGKRRKKEKGKRKKEKGKRKYA